MKTRIKMRKIKPFRRFIKRTFKSAELDRIKKILSQEDRLFELFKKDIKETREENKSLNLPNVMCIDGKIIYELPNGKIVENYEWSKNEQIQF